MYVNSRYRLMSPCSQGDGSSRNGSIRVRGKDYGGVGNVSQGREGGNEGGRVRLSRICRDPPRNARKWRRFGT
jgi:hypothetical protein